MTCLSEYNYLILFYLRFYLSLVYLSVNHFHVYTAGTELRGSTLFYYGLNNTHYLVSDLYFKQNNFTSPDTIFFLLISSLLKQWLIIFLVTQMAWCLQATCIMTYRQLSLSVKDLLDADSEITMATWASDSRSQEAEVWPCEINSHLISWPVSESSIPMGNANMSLSSNVFLGKIKLAEFRSPTAVCLTVRFLCQN